VARLLEDALDASDETRGIGKLYRSLRSEAEVVQAQLTDLIAKVSAIVARRTEIEVSPRKGTSFQSDVFLEVARVARISGDAVYETGLMTGDANRKRGDIVATVSTALNGTPTTDQRLPGGHQAAIGQEDFDAIQSILRSRYKAPRSSTRKTRPYLLKGLLYCNSYGERVYSQFSNRISYYRESSPSRGILCTAAGEYWPAKAIDRQIEEIVLSIELTERWRERALEIASSENNLVEMRNERGDLDRRRQRYTHLYKEELIPRDEFDREMARIENRLSYHGPGRSDRSGVVVSRLRAFP